MVLKIHGLGFGISLARHISGKTLDYTGRFKIFPGVVEGVEIISSIILRLILFRALCQGGVIEVDGCRVVGKYLEAGSVIDA